MEKINALFTFLSENTTGKLSEYTSKISSLSSERQKKLFDSICKDIDIAYYDEMKDVCKNEGHIYGDWYEEVNYVEVIGDVNNLAGRGRIFKEQVHWRKRCERCNDSIISHKKPEGVKILKKEYGIIKR